MSSRYLNADGRWEKPVFEDEDISLMIVMLRDFQSGVSNDIDAGQAANMLEELQELRKLSPLTRT